MSTSRLEAFSDGVIAIIITIMVLEFKVPHDSHWEALLPLVPTFISYMLSFIMVGIYWNNHHHLLHSAQSVSGRVLWANLHLLFWLSVIPFVTAWVGETNFDQVPVAVQGVVMLMAGVSYYLLSQSLIHHHGKDSPLARAVGSDLKGIASLILYSLGVGLTFVHPWAGFGVYIVVAAVWFIPDRRFERARIKE